MKGIQWLKRKRHVILKRHRDKIDYEKLNRCSQRNGGTKSSIDDITWLDLTMNDIFDSMNYTVSSPGEEVLYTWLKHPLDDVGKLNKRKKQIEEIRQEKERSDKLRLKISKLRYCRFDVQEALEGDLPRLPVLLVVFMALAIVNFALIFYSIASRDFSLLVYVITLLAINIFIHFKFALKYERQLEVLRYLLGIINFARNNRGLIESISHGWGEKIKSLNKQLGRIITGQSALFRVEGIDVFADYINIAFLLKEINFLRVSKVLRDKNELMLDLYQLVGEIDAVMSIIEYQKHLEQWCEPDYIEGEKTFDIDGMYYPLLEEPVSNSLDFVSSIVVTGSNMSGKSTFLRSVGLNALFAQSICTSLSKKHRTSCFRLITSISLSDDVISGSSYFMMEAQAIGRMIAYKDDAYPTMMIIDEIFKGTNPIERLAASMEILNDLTQGNTKVLVSTHDLQILPELKGYVKFYFTEHVTEESITFDYKMKKGVTTTRNAIKLMAHIKYPKDVIDRINKRIEEMAL